MTPNDYETVETIEFCRQIAGSWLVAERYEIAGDLIIPVAGTAFAATRPWRSYETWLTGPRAKHRDDAPPHVAFEALGRWLDEQPRTFDEKATRVTEFVSNHGLLGLAVHRTTEALPVSHEGPALLVPSRRPLSSSFKTIEVTRGIDKYYPRKERSWGGYGEPVEDICGYALRLHSAVEALRHQDDYGQFVVDMSVMSLNEMTKSGNEQLVINTETGRLERRWVFGTLIAAIAYMCVLTLSGTSDVDQCAFEGCYNMFRKRTSISRYCSDNCQWAATRRGQRRRAKERTNGN